MHSSNFCRKRFLVPILLFTMTSSVSAEIQRELAIARSLENGQLLFKEEHWVRTVNDQPQERWVIYRCLDNRAFARKQVNYDKNLVTPSFLLKDARSGYVEGMQYTSSGKQVVWDGPSEPEKTAVLEGQNIVSDAGFDEWVRQSWGPLTQGQALEMQFLVPSRLRAYEFNVEQVPSSLTGSKAFRLQLGGLIGWALPSIKVFYDIESKRLRRFEGLSNLRDDRGESPMQVRIDFPEQPSVVSVEKLNQAIREPLIACPVYPG